MEDSHETEKTLMAWAQRLDAEPNRRWPAIDRVMYYGGFWIPPVALLIWVTRCTEIVASAEWARACSPA